MKRFAWTRMLPTPKGDDSIAWDDCVAQRFVAYS
jgi:hypothetical protein